jgi:peptidoglycan glycosyltransferase
MTFVGAIASNGKGVKPYLVGNISSDGINSYSAKKQTGERLMSEKTALVVKEYMGFNVSDKYGSENFPGMTVCAKTGTAEVGGGKKPNAVFTGFVADDEYPLAFIAVVEDGGYGREICIPMISKVLSACKEMIDS